MPSFFERFLSKLHSTHFLKPESGAPEKPDSTSSNESVASHAQMRRVGHPQNSRAYEPTQKARVLGGLEPVLFRFLTQSNANMEWRGIADEF